MNRVAAASEAVTALSAREPSLDASFVRMSRGSWGGEGEKARVELRKGRVGIVGGYMGC